MSLKSSEDGVRTRVEAQSLLREIVAPATGKAAWRVAQRKLRWSYNRVRDVYYADPRIKISGAEIDQLRLAKSQRQTEGPTIFELQAQLGILAERLARLDPGFHIESLQAVRRAPSADGGSEDRHSESV
jgi:hypothetical protein